MTNEKYENLRERYISSAPQGEKKQIRTVFRKSAPIEFASGIPMEEFSGTEWNRLFKESVWDDPKTARHIRYSVRRYAAFLEENGVAFNLSALDETLGQSAEAWANSFFISFQEMNETLAKIPFRGGRYNKGALVLSLRAIGLKENEIAMLTKADINEWERTIQTERTTIENVEPFVFRFIPLEGEKLIQVDSAMPVTKTTIQNIEYRVERYRKVDSPRSLIPTDLELSYFFLKLDAYERTSGELVENLSKREWFYEQCRRWSGIVDDEITFSSLIRDYNRLKKLR